MTISNRKALRAMARAMELAAEHADSNEWDADAQELYKALKYAAKHLRPLIEKK
jgi:hypothetical protein